MASMSDIITPMTSRETYTVPEAAALLGLSPWMAYQHIANDRWPTPVLRVGRRILIPRSPLHRLLDPHPLREAVAGVAVVDAVEG